MQDMRQIYEEYAHTVYGFLMNLTGGDRDLAEELTQETFFRAIKNSASFKGECKVSTWLCQIAKFTFYQYIEKKQKHREVPLEEAEQTGNNQSVEQQVLDRDAKLRVYQKIQALPGEMKDVLMLRMTGELSFREIGNIFGKTENWARVTYYRGKQMLGKELEKDV